MHTKGRRLGLLLLLLAWVFPLMAGAEPLGEQVVFDGPIVCKYLDIDRAEFARTEDGFLVTLVYRLHDDLSQAQMADLEIISFNLMPDEASTEFPRNFQSGVMGRVDGKHEEHLQPGVQYFDQGTWQPVEQMPGVLYLRPYYKFMGEWGDAIVLDVKADEVRPIESAEDMPKLY